MKSHMITGGAGTQLHVIEGGQANGRPILFIHGFSQCSLVWARQMSSELAHHCRLVAMDIRGHGRSDKPHDGYGDSKLWADDIHAVIQALHLDHPLICGWSYGPLVILDYIRHYGEERIAGINLIGGVTKLGSEEAASVLTADFLALLPGFFSTDAEQSVNSLAELLRLCFKTQLSPEERYLMLGYNVGVPPYVRQALFSRSFDNDDLLPMLKKPVLVTHGSDDAVVKPTVIDRQMARIAHLSIRMVENAGHGCFWDQAPAYNRYLQEFLSTV